MDSLTQIMNPEDYQKAITMYVKLNDIWVSVILLNHYDGTVELLLDKESVLRTPFLPKHERGEAK